MSHSKNHVLCIYDIVRLFSRVRRTQSDKNAIQKISNKISTNSRISTVPLEAGEHDLSLGGFKPVHDTGNAALVVIVTEQDELPVDKFLVGDSSLGLVVQVQFTFTWEILIL